MEQGLERRLDAEPVQLGLMRMQRARSGLLDKILSLLSFAELFNLCAYAIVLILLLLSCANVSVHSIVVVLIIVRLRLSCQNEEARTALGLL